jgi:GNAT superfamily N-acetyltransferase
VGSNPAVTVRRMTDDDLPAAGQVQVAAFDDLERRLGGYPTTDQPADRAQRIWARHHHFVVNDPDGSWVATIGEEIIGSALALKRTAPDGASLWGLSLLVVDPKHQSSGAGRALLDASLNYADGCETAIILSSTDVRAMRAYATSGFELYPQMSASGQPSGFPTIGRKVRETVAADFELLDAIDVEARGAPHGPDHELMGSTQQGFVIDDVDGRGYAWVRKDGEVFLLAATDDATATALLWRSLAHLQEIGGHAVIDHLNAEQQWAIRVAYDARLAVKPDGPVFWRGRTPPRSYLASGAYL